ncbi:sterol desaturase family protein [Pseudomonas sp. HK3]
MSEYNINGLAIPLFLIIMCIEYLFLRLSGRNLHRYNDSVTSLSMGLCLLISDALLKAYTFAVFIYIWQNHRMVDFSSTDIITWVVFFFGVDFCYYWFHRLAHEVNFLWGAHVGHHQSEEYNLTTALRQSAFQYAFSWVFYLPLALFGCPPQVFLIQFIILKLYQFWLHTQAVHKVPLVEGILSTPSSHRVHHAKNPKYIDRNYGGTLVIWDRVFRTWQPELVDEPCHYGTTQPLNTLNPIKANLQHWALLAKDTIHTESWKNKITLWIKPTGWRPDDCQDRNTNTRMLQKSGSLNRKKYNPQTTPLIKMYVGLSMLVTFLVTTLFVFLAPSLSGAQLIIGVGLILTGLVIANDLLENKTRFALIEIVRLPLILWFTSTLWFSTMTTNIVDHITINRSTIETLNYASSVALWPQWHPQSTKVYAPTNGPLTKGKSFEEDINTPIGMNHLVWEIIDSQPGQLWYAHAINQNNGVKIELEYRVTDINGQTHFQRTLNYTMPNALLTAFNALYFEKLTEKKSKDALLRLKSTIESL